MEGGDMRTGRKRFTEEEKQFVRDNIWRLGAPECAIQMNRSVGAIYRNARELGVELNPIHRFNTFDVSCITDLTDPFVIYFLGYFWADGAITSELRHRIKFKIVKDDFEAAIRPHIERLGTFWNYKEYSDVKRPKWRTVSVLEITDLGLWRFLDNHGYRDKSLISPESILQAISESLRHYWWRGYLDGDGSVSADRSCRISFNSGYDQDWTFIHTLGRQLDIDFYIERKDRGTRKGSKADISNQVYVRRLVEYLYQGEKFGLERKRLRCEALVARPNYKPQGPGTSIYRGVYYCVQRNTFVMQIGTKKTHVCKHFKDEIVAAQEYDRLARGFFGNRAVLNFPV